MRFIPSRLVWPPTAMNFYTIRTHGAVHEPPISVLLLFSRVVSFEGLWLRLTGFKLEILPMQFNGFPPQSANQSPFVWKTRLYTIVVYQHVRPGANAGPLTFAARDAVTRHAI